MSRTKQKARKKGNARDIQRDRNRDLAIPRQKDPSGSKQPVSADSLRMKVPGGTGTEQKANKARQRVVKRTQARVALMKSRSTNFQDFRLVNCDKLGKDHDHFNAQKDREGFRVLFFAGFLCYSHHSKGCRKMVKVESFRNLKELAETVAKLLRPQFHSVLGLEEEMYEVAGYEIRFPEDFVCGEVVAKAGQPILVQSGHLLSAWAEQAYRRRHKETPGIIVRIIKPGGAIFDPTFRTPAEGEKRHRAVNFKEQSQPTSESLESIELGRRDDSVPIVVNERQKARPGKKSRRRESGEQAGPDTDSIESLMERQHLSDGAENTKDGAMNISSEGQATGNVPSYIAEQNEMDVDG